jgi:hypothetical protein
MNMCKRSLCTEGSSTVPHGARILQRLPGLLAAVLPVLLSGCGGAALVVVCVGINTPPGFCKPDEHPAERVLTIRNNCPFPVEIAGIGHGQANASNHWALTEHGSTGDSARFHVPVSAQQSVSWSGVLVPDGSHGSADLTFVHDGPDIYKVEAPEGQMVPLALRPAQSVPSPLGPEAERWCTPAIADPLGGEPHSCRTDGVENRMDYVLTLCSTADAGQE